MADLLALATDGYLTSGTGGGITLLEVSAINIEVDSPEYQIEILNQEITIIIEED